MTPLPPEWGQALDGDVRANPAYRLRSLGSLPEGSRRALQAMGVGHATVFGLLVAEPHSGLPDKVVDAAAARLFARLSRPRRPPAEARGRLVELVLDGVLEIETTAGFASGPVAYETVVEGEDPVAPHDRLSELSHAALAYGERLRLADVAALTARLYSYHRIPLCRRWADAYPSPDAVLDVMRTPGLGRDWLGPGETEGGLDWLSWARRDDRLDAPSARFLYKLYVSPHIEAVPAVLAVLVEALSRTSASRFKVGADAFGLLRPDKIVVYLVDVTELEAVAAEVARALDGVAPHGVPFSAELAGGGLLSWGGDPPTDAGPVGGGVESWRLSLCRRLAEALVAAQRAPLRRTSPRQFALARLAVDGVDTESFAPAALDRPRRAPSVGLR